ncbi:hybrid sensor histidine kinase/response regulator [Butyrivibrio sp. MC2013]|uniref:hybrid sensor histidine kinase/response regulator n=1 Tax=Butyrivibrio sp. MC2013 TaxID=1280686 RepID=UPI00042164EC|nr:ATP-binding protein [Butyrivibrio sp. MC2013]
MDKRSPKAAIYTVIALAAALFMMLLPLSASAHDYGGGYAVTKQLPGVGYTAEVYDASNGLPTSDAMNILAASDGHIWIGGYSGVIRYDGSKFERLDTSTGLTSARVLFEDSKGRIWVGTNDNGVVVIDHNEYTHLSYESELPASSIRTFEEDGEGNVFIGTTSGICYADPDMNIHLVSNNLLDKERILKMDYDNNGIIYGQTGNGYLFTIKNCKVTKIYTSSNLGIEEASTIMVDPVNEGMIYIGTEGSVVYHGTFGQRAAQMETISVAPLEGIYCISYECGRVWISSLRSIGYLDALNKFTLISGLPFDSGIEMMTSDYQGNMWFASSTQGVMKLVSNNFLDYNKYLMLPGDVTNAVCIHNGYIYIGTDNGLMVIRQKDGIQVINELAKYLTGTRIRCIKADNKGNLWIACFNNDLGLVCYDSNSKIKNYTRKNGMPDNQVRSIYISSDNKILAGTNGGLAVLKDGGFLKTVGANDGMKNTVLLTVSEYEDGSYLVGTDGDGLYKIDKKGLTRLGREDGLTSDVVMRIVKDDERGVYWLVTSNSIEYIKDGRIREISSFPYNNNYDIYLQDNGLAWILSSYGIYEVKIEDMLNDSISDYRLFTVENGMPYAITSNSYSAIDEDGYIYIAGRDGVIKADIANGLDYDDTLLTDINAVYCDDERIYPGENGIYMIPASDGRIEIDASVMDYSMMNPTVHVYLEGLRDEGITVPRSQLTSLDYTRLPYGNYLLHIQILDKVSDSILQDDVYSLIKRPRFTELLIVRLAFMAMVILLAGFIVWRFMKSTVVSRQYEEIRLAKEEAENANKAKTRFLANMSHEIRTPINTIMGMNEMIMRENASGVPKGYYLAMFNYSMDIRNASEALLSLVNDLLDMSKMESGKMHLVEQDYDSVDMLRSIVAMIRPRSTEKELGFDVVIDEILPVKFYGDSGKIKQIVLNLLTNAVKYTAKGGICLTVSMDERQDDKAVVRFSVKDTGMGVRQEDMDKLFAAYERLDEEKNSNIQGTGLGLDISRRFAELMGGRLWCESVYGEGSDFIFTLTQKIVDDSPLGIFKEREETSSSGQYIPKFVAPDADILVVDDNSMNLNVIKGLLKATRVFVTTSTSGEDALEKIKVNDYDLVFLDHMMPGMDGIETVAEIRKTHPDLPVYALTANATAGEEFYKSKGFNGYLAKPIETQKLEETIMKHLPEEKMEKPGAEDVVTELDEMPENMFWIYETEGISADEGIRNSGGISNYIYSLNLFLDTIDENYKVISDSYESDNIRLYTIKVHALKSSARIIGAMELSEKALQLEDAGNRKDKAYIDAHTTELLEDYLAYKDKLKNLKENNKKSQNLPKISEEDLKDAYEALRDVIPQMDYDSVEMILEQLSEYRLPDEDEERIEELDKLLKLFDWETMEELINKSDV